VTGAALAVLADAATPLELTKAQAMWLVYLEHSKGCGAARKHPVLCALETRGLARFGGTRARPRLEAWHATVEGREWLEARRAADRDAAR
jgi:hypothetical protein